MTNVKVTYMTQKSEFLLKKAQELILKAKAHKIDLVVCGGLAIHMLSDFSKRNSTRAWNHKDIDFLVPLSQFSKTIAFFKEIGFVRAFIPTKKSRLTKNNIRFANVIEGQKILVDVYGLSIIPIIRITCNESEITLISPQFELENWLDRKKRLGSKPAINLTINFLNEVIRKDLFKEEEIC